ncbi:MAG: hypothetical protein ACKPEA_10795 [Planctomycetota bacterium]
MRRFVAAMPLLVALAALAQAPAPPAPAVNDALTTVADLRRRVGN